MDRRLVILITAALISVTWCATGCLGIGNTHVWGEKISPTWSVDHIIKWTLAQTNADDISDGVATLTERGCQDERYHASRREADKAVAGIEAIYRKLEGGWPGFTGVNRMVTGHEQGPLPEAAREEERERSITHIYYDLGGYGGCPRELALFYKIKPDPQRFPARYEAWRNQALQSKLDPYAKAWSPER